MVCILSDEELGLYIPAYGDRVAVASFCRQNTVQSANRADLLERVIQKIGARKRNANSSDLTQAQRPQTFLPKEKPKKRAPPEKLERRINIGWLHYRSIDGYKQVRLDQGGGVRSVTVDRYAAYDDILEKGKELYFPGGHSTKGPIEDFKFDLCDFKRASVDKGETIAEMYHKTKLPLIRLYICTKARETSSDEEESEPANNDGTDNYDEEGTAVGSKRAARRLTRNHEERTARRSRRATRNQLLSDDDTSPPSDSAVRAARRATRNQPLSDDDTSTPSDSAVTNTHVTEAIVVQSESDNESSEEVCGGVFFTH